MREDPLHLLVWLIVFLIIVAILWKVLTVVL